MSAHLLDDNQGCRTDTKTLDGKARLFRALGDPSRLAVLEALRRGPRCVSDLVAETRLSQPNVSGHLAFLRECGLVKREQRGRFAYYTIAAIEVETIVASAESLLCTERK
ncbi:MAG: metalloregulator ArsR/SmtB family transcription factor [Dehalococcoidia bacterium]|nr:metalloregulator ArsR/SmtB family transcription factor [Dehalococcoidia bacterium]